MSMFVAYLGPHVAAAVNVGHDHAVMLEVRARRRGHVVHLLAQRARGDGHVCDDASELVDSAAVRSCDIHHDRRRHLGAVGQHDAFGPAGASDPSHGHAEEELGAGQLGRQPQVVGGELRVADVAAFGRPERAPQLRGRLGPELRIAELAGRAETGQVERAEPGDGLAAIPDLVGNAERIEIAGAAAGDPQRR